MSFVYPTNAELTLIAQDKIARLAKDRPIFGIMPMKDVDAAILMWEQQGNYIGLQQARGYNGEPNRVIPVGGSRYIAQPGVYGEYADIDELELTTRRSFGTYSQSVNIDDLVIGRQDQLLGRRLDRLEYIGWKLLTSGAYSVATPQGAIVHTDSYTLQTYTATTPWATFATAGPLNDLRNVALLHRGHSVTFDRTATAWMNQSTANRMLNNTNSADIYGRRVTGLATANSVAGVNQIFTEDNLPNIAVYDETYFDDQGNVNLFIPTGVVVVIGKRPLGQTVMDYAMTRNASNPNLEAGAYMDIEDNIKVGRKPRLIKVHDGHNGGPRVYYPSAIVVMSV